MYVYHTFVHVIRLLIQADSNDKSSQLSSPRSKSQTLKAIAEVKLGTTEKEKAACRAKYGVSIKENPFLDLPIDLHRYLVILVCSGVHSHIILGVRLLKFCTLFCLAHINIC